MNDCETESGLMKETHLHNCLISGVVARLVQSDDLLFITPEPVSQCW